MSVVDAESGAMHPTARCISAQAAAEKALKALLTAHGRAIPFRHDLVDLGTEVRKAGENLPDTVTIPKLQDLSEYGGPAQYPRWRGRTTARRLRESCDTARALTGHARRRVPEILESRRRQPTRQDPAAKGRDGASNTSAGNMRSNAAGAPRPKRGPDGESCRDCPD